MLWPPACILCRNYCCETVCKECKTKSHLFIGGSSFAGAQDSAQSCAPACRSIYAAGVYAGTYKDAVKDYKFHGQLWIGKGLADIMFNMLLKQGIFDEPSCITYVPVSEKRFAERGFDQCEFMAKIIAEKAGVECKKLLRRRTQGGTQSRFNRKERLENSRDRFECSTDSLKTKRIVDITDRIILIDDILTTGATLQECATVLSQHGFKNIIGAVAATGRKDI